MFIYVYLDATNHEIRNVKFGSTCFYVPQNVDLTLFSNGFEKIFDIA